MFYFAMQVVLELKTINVYFNILNKSFWLFSPFCHTWFYKLWQTQIRLLKNLTLLKCFVYFALNLVEL